MFRRNPFGSLLLALVLALASAAAAGGPQPFPAGDGAHQRSVPALARMLPETGYLLITRMASL